MSAPSIAEGELLIKFREKVKDVLQTKEQHDDSYLLRWLRARDLNLRKAEDMLRASIKWRAENQVDNVLNIQVDPVIKSEFPWFIEGTDKHNQPVFIFPVGKYDFRKPLVLGKVEEFKTYFIHFYEQAIEKMRELNKNRDPNLYPITQFTTIGDWDGYSYSQLVNYKAVQNMLHVASLYEAHYPELLFRSIFINCPSFFNLVMEILKPLMTQRTLGKIFVYGKDQGKWEKAMREVMDDDQVSKVIKRIKSI